MHHHLKQFAQMISPETLVQHAFCLDSWLHLALVLTLALALALALGLGLGPQMNQVDLSLTLHQQQWAQAASCHDKALVD
jgi:hypothetical protein